MRIRPATRQTRAVLLAAALASVAALGAACSSSAASQNASSSKINAVGAENEYADVISQVGGQYVNVSAIMSNPATDPHTFEASPQVAAEVSGAQLVVQNGIGYDDFMTKIEQNNAGANRKVVNVQNLLGLPDSTPNPHLWYKPSTMPAVAAAIASDLETLDPAHAAAFKANLATFDSSLGAWNTAISQLKATYGGAAVATTEPVADYLLDAAGIKNLTPFAFQADVMNGTDPSPQDVSAEQALFTAHKVKAFVYNQQVTDSLTQSLLALAKSDGVPIVGVYETMPTPGYDYQKWMLAEVSALSSAIGSGASAPTL
ncbi:metal ABC transporter solute-binding protein, Zn/Mn family [Actinospica sp.]|jgi:zinc/manganese transport system substrate-binding protein|uniref:metal ABC transporter solute-binding protein, Zn/Mn family n=1 Tax=Actinospica sp. TaxID=1872142 RepID=UPI002CACAEB0|nr:zinc ABC transporter substrate-binding protein [Actinospica sp.]HWG28637.1 zinc ABC transporter substrate-binding protein [Actinospica sp.]